MAFLADPYRCQPDFLPYALLDWQVPRRITDCAANGKYDVHGGAYS